MRLSLVLLAVSASLASSVKCQWTIQDSHTTASLRGIHYVGKGVAWASGTGGTVLRTLDMGKTWTPCAVPPQADKLDFRGVQAFDAQTAIVMSSGKGDLSRLYKTVDGCKTWKLVFTNPDKDGFWDAMKFVDSSNGFLMGDPVEGSFPLFETATSGQSWKRIDGNKLKAYQRQDSGESAFAASNSSMLVIDERDEILLVTGGERNFLRSITFVEDAHSPLCQGSCVIEAGSPTGLATGPSAGGFALALDKTGNHLLIVGGDYAKPDAVEGVASVCTVRHLDVLSKYDCRAASAPPHGYRSSIDHEIKTKAWITVGPNGTDVSIDDGQNWRPLTPNAEDSPDADKNWNALSLPFVVGPKGRIGVLREGALTGGASPAK